MGLFSSKRIFFADPALIPGIAEELALQFETEGYTVKHEKLTTGDADISITKGAFFRAVVGLKNALKIFIKRDGSHILAEAGIGIFGMQVVPTLIAIFLFYNYLSEFFWVPVVITQTWGLVKQSKLDNHTMELIENSIKRLTAETNSASSNGAEGNFCPECGKRASGKRCASCGAKLC